MKKLLPLLFFTITSFVTLANEYEDVRVTGLIFNAKDNYVEFTIDKAPDKTISTKAYSEATQDYVVSMLISAYREHEYISYIRIKDFDKNKNKKVLPLRSVKFADTFYATDVEIKE